ncbi:ATP-binding protein [Flavobacteriaceae bacterium F08102]|nr:ATP-binding protein [Flavobacteriaceae bacterium F08102]
MKIKKTYKFAFKSSGYLALFTFIILNVVDFFLYKESMILSITFVCLLVFTISFFILQFRVQRFIYSRVKKIYDEVSMLNVEDLSRKSITSDMESLSQNVKKFAENKRLEIEMLQIRERYRREFLGNVSHELKTPLFTVQGYLLTLSDGAVEDKSIRDKYLHRANKGVERLINVVQDLDMISKLETGYLNPKMEMFNIVKLVQSTFDLLEIKAKKRKIKLRFNKVYDTPIFVKADQKRIEQVLINLIENSIKYGNFNGQTIVSIKNFSSKKVAIHISDDGEGIEKLHLKRIFERFYRVDQSRSREQGGSGLGLSIVKHIIEAHQEKVYAESEVGKGTTFSFTLEKFE